VPTASGPTVLDRVLDLSPDVAVRPEAFGALLYSFGTRRLSFLKDRRLLDVVQRLADASDARAACAQAGIGESELAAYDVALSRLLRTGLLRERAQ
jgi:putative mycofactocin binding protein MftB